MPGASVTRTAMTPSRNAVPRVQTLGTRSKKPSTGADPLQACRQDTYPLAGACNMGHSVCAARPIIQLRSSSDSQDRAVWASCTWPRYPPTRDEGKLEPHMTRRGVKASITRLKSSCSVAVRLAYGPRLVLDTRK